MTGRRVTGLMAAGAVGALALAACATGSGSPSSPAGFNAATERVVNPSSHRGGTLSFGLSGGVSSRRPAWSRPR
jgi:peptide/nickel transport system substrate-binding protein